VKQWLINNRKLLAAILTIILLSVALAPIITSDNNQFDGDIMIINVQSYPVVGGEWTVMFTTVGRANLTITAVNSTLWSNSDSIGCDLRFLNIKRGNETLDYEWVNNSVFIANFSSNETCYETSKVLTSGVHILMFQFGDDVAYANNVAGEYWLQTSTSDFNNGTKSDVNVSDDAFHLNETYYIRNYTQIDDESFEGATWPPTGWSETAGSRWEREDQQAYDGSWSADFDGQGGGRSGDLYSPTMDCSDIANITAIYVDFYYRDESADPGEFRLYYYDGIGWDPVEDLADDIENQWNHYTEKIVDSQYFKSNFQIRWSAIDIENGESVYVDLVNVTLEKNISGYVTSGSLISEAHNTSRNVPDYTSITVDNSTPGGTTITTWIRAADTQANLSTATWYNSVGQIPDEQWVQWRINLTGDEDNTPTVNAVNLTWNYDDEDPVSSVDAVTHYWQNNTPFTVTVTASDTGGSGIKEVALYYNFSADNASGWTGWSLFGVNDTVSPYSWSFTAPDGDGYYRFYSIAADNESNVEDPPVGYDNISGVDTVDPISQVDDIAQYWHDETTNPLAINVSSATDTLSGVKNVTLYYRYREDNESSWPASWTSYGVDDNAPWQWNFYFSDGNGHYQFYSIAADNASNKENAPVAPDNDTECGYNSILPISEVDAISPYWQTTSPSSITGQATDNSGSGLYYVTLYYYNSTDNSTWFGPWNSSNDSDPWSGVSWSFTFPNGSGYYRFYSIAVDNSSNVEEFTGNDTMCGFDDAKPSSQLDTISLYWQNTSPITINATASDTGVSGLKNVTLYYYDSNDNSSWSGPWSVGTDSASPWSWSFSFPNGTGYYRFYSIAADNASNVEDFTSNDTMCGYDTQKPTSQVDPISPYWKGDPDNPLNITITDPTDDLSGISNISLYYKYRADNDSIWGSWMLYGTDQNSPWSWLFNFPDGNGHYAFYSRATDNAGNYEGPPGTPDNDTRCGFSGSAFVAHLWSESNSVSSADLTLTSSANANGPGTGTWADANGKWSKTPYEYWDFIIEDLSLLGPINNATLYLKHRQSGWVDENFLIQIWDGSSWLNVQSYGSGSGPPTGDTLDSWNVMALGIDDWTKVNAAIVRIIGDGTNPPEEIVDWFVDTVELRVKVEYPVIPVINSYDLRNSTGSKLNDATGLLDLNKEYYFTINVTDDNGWDDISYINITAWYDQGDEETTYNQTLGGNLNMFLQYENTTGTANFRMLWPDDEAQLVLGNCSETIINSTTRIINISFRPLGQVRWANSNDTWLATPNICLDAYSWNFNITVIDAEDNETWKVDEYGVYKYTSILPDSDWVDVYALPDTYDDSSIVTITYSSNYDYNMTIFFKENLTHTKWPSYYIAIADSVTILADADLNDDITTDIDFMGIGEANSVDIFNVSGLFQANGSSQTVQVQFRVYIPFGTMGGKYTAYVGTKISNE